MNIHTRHWQAVIVLAYLLIGSLFAIHTPAWQAPDEPAHYNYVHAVAVSGVLPVLQASDYDQAQQTLAITARFAPGVSIAAFRYEFHQPPLYYLLAAPIFRLTNGALLPLRLFSLGLGALLLLVVYQAARLIVRPALALGAMAFVAFLPMHLAMLSAVNNDSLAELLIALLIWQSLRLLTRPLSPAPWSWLALGVTAGLGLAAKTTVYGLLPMLAAALFLAWRRRTLPPRRAAGLILASLLCILIIAAPWWLRNLAIYGGADFMGLDRHDDVVQGQLRTADYAAQAGWDGLAKRFVVWTFRSFWGQFGWMSVLLDERIYTALLILSTAAAMGALWTLAQRGRQPGVAGPLLILGLALAGASGGYLWYNLSFVQHQGRYLFPALIPLAIGFAAGLSALAHTWPSRLAAAAALSGALLTLILAPGRWHLLLWAGAAVLLALLPRLGRWQSWLYGGVFAGLAALDIASLFWFIVPQLRP